MSLHNPNYFRTFIATGLVVIATTGEYAAEPLGCKALAPFEYCDVTPGARPWVADEPTGTIRLPDPAAHLTTPIISGGGITATIKAVQGPQFVNARLYNNSLDVEHTTVGPGRSILKGPSLPPVWIADVDGSKPKA
jgi:hypothetical protein